MPTMNGNQARVKALSVETVAENELLPLLQLAHELRSPLAAIQSCLDMVLQGYTAGNPKLQDELVSTARNRAATMLDQVNDFMRLGAVRYAQFKRRIQPVQLLDVIQQLLSEMRVRARWRGVDLGIQVPDNLPYVRGTYEDAEHLLSNLISNAIKYTAAGGQVTVRLWATADEVLGSVEDTGMGIAAQDLPFVFDEFYRADNARRMDAHGTGLGLAIVKRIVETYAGRIEVWSEQGVGSTFTFAFPQIDDSVRSG